MSNSPVTYPVNDDTIAAHSAGYQAGYAAAKQESGEKVLRIQLESMPQGKTSGRSLEIRRPDGSLLCKINVFDFGEGRGDVDVILTPDQRGRFLAWDKGIPQVNRETVEGTTVHAIDIKPR